MGFAAVSFCSRALLLVQSHQYQHVCVCWCWWWYGFAEKDWVGIWNSQSLHTSKQTCLKLISFHVCLCKMILGLILEAVCLLISGFLCSCCYRFPSNEPFFPWTPSAPLAASPQLRELRNEFLIRSQHRDALCSRAGVAALCSLQLGAGSSLSLGMPFTWNWNKNKCQSFPELLPCLNEVLHPQKCSPGFVSSRSWKNQSWWSPQQILSLSDLPWSLHWVFEAGW